MLEILAHPDLSHEFVLVSVHAGEGTNMCENVLECVGELECIDIAKTVLNVGVHDELGQTQNLTAKMEGIAEPGLFAFLRGESYVMETMVRFLDAFVNLVSYLCVGKEVIPS